MISHNFFLYFICALEAFAKTYIMHLPLMIQGVYIYYLSILEDLHVLVVIESV